MNEAEQLLLWRWSTIVQMTSLAMAAAFFALLARATRRAELRTWAWAWAANFVALAVTALFWVVQPPAPVLPVVRGLYFAAKASFVLLLIEGAWKMARPNDRWLSRRQVAIGIVLYAVAGVALIRGVTNVGIFQHLFMAAALLGFAAAAWRGAAAGMSWLVAAIAIRGVLAVAEAGAYIVQAGGEAASVEGLWEAVSIFVSISSSFDMAFEWLVVLGCVLAVSERGRRELQDANRGLLSAQEDLRRLADRDPLTALVNRRSLPEIFRAVQPQGALLLFFDLDGFKRINDQQGHAAGDACLKHFAQALRDSFRPDDHVIRYGGDEFLVVANGLDTAHARMRVDEVRRRMVRAGGVELVCKFSVGMAELEPGGQPEAALEAADAQMYKAKHQVIA
jgi:diguanylate cyclase (GGDEF)-like protein